MDTITSPVSGSSFLILVDNCATSKVQVDKECTGTSLHQFAILLQAVEENIIVDTNILQKSDDAV